jgi:hypothetical protein
MNGSCNRQQFVGNTTKQALHYTGNKDRSRQFFLNYKFNPERVQLFARARACVCVYVHARAVTMPEIEDEAVERSSTGSTTI